MRRRAQSPGQAILETLFDRLFYASLETEESRHTTFDVVYLDPDNPDPKPPPSPRSDRWQFVRFDQPLPFAVSSLAKLAQASDARTSSLAVHALGDELFVWGLVDQGNSYHDFVNFDVESGQERPGLFQARVLGVGHIAVCSVDALRNGPIRALLNRGINGHLDEVQRLLAPDELHDWIEWSSWLSEDWVEALCRLLIRSRSHRHGGAILITRDLTNEDLAIKYAISYDRMSTSLLARAALDVRHRHATDGIHKLMNRRASDLPLRLYLDEAITRDRDRGLSTRTGWRSLVHFAADSS